MPIRRYLALIMSTVAACLLIGNVLVSYGLVRPHFARLETEEALRDNVRAMNAVVHDFDQLQTLVNDWAVWDDSYEFMSGVDVPDFMKSNLTPEAFRILDVDRILFITLDGGVAWDGVLDRSSGEIVTPARDDVRAVLLAACPSVSGCAASRKAGLVGLPGRMALVATSPIVTSMGRGPARGILLFARVLDGTEAGYLTERAQVRVRIEPAPQGRPAGAGVRDAVTVEKHPDVTKVQSLLPGLSIDQAFRIVTESPRRIGALGDRVVALALGASVAVLVVVGAVASWLVEFKVAQPAHRLARKFSAARGERSEASRANGNEFELIEAEFDRTLAALHETQQKMSEMNYYAGMAEMFSGMAHNLRNALTPMSLNLWRLRDVVMRHRRPLDHHLGTEGGVPGPSLPFEDGTAVSGNARDQEVERILDLLENQVMDMDQTLQDHHVFSRYGRHLTPTRVREVVRDAAEVFMGAARQKVALRLLPELDRVPDVQAHPVILKQVLGNLIVNAREAIVMSATAKGEIVVGAESVTADGINWVRIRVGDNGVGIAPDDMGRLFERGYSTKRQSSGGIGLHWCANVISAMEGNLRAESAGPGKGATFTVTLRAA